MTNIKTMVAEAMKKLDKMTPEEFTKMLLECGYSAEELLYASIEKNAELEALLMEVRLRGEPMRGESHWITVDDVDGMDWFEARDWRLRNLTGECPVHREAKHCCGAQGFGFGDVCPACELETRG